MSPLTPPPGHDVSSSPMRQMLGGSLRANDPRQFLVEVMVGAIRADGRVDRREEEALERILAEHDLFSSLPAHAVPALIELASDAFYFAGGVAARLTRIAAALPWRLQRIAAYGMAAELVAADDVVTPDEETYLRSLRRALQIGTVEADELTAAARSKRGLSTLDQLSRRVRDFADKATRTAVALRRQRTAIEGAEAARIEELIASMVDFVKAPRPDPARIERMAVELAPAPGDAAIELASRIRDAADRYWAMAYALAVDTACGAARPWRSCELAPVLRLAFELSEGAMDRCEAHAGRIAERLR